MRDDRLFKMRHVEKRDDRLFKMRILEKKKKKNDKYTGDALHNKYPERRRRKKRRKKRKKLQKVENRK